MPNYSFPLLPEMCLTAVSCIATSLKARDGFSSRQNIPSADWPDHRKQLCLFPDFLTIGQRTADSLFEVPRARMKQNYSVELKEYTQTT